MCMKCAIVASVAGIASSKSTYDYLKVKYHEAKLKKDKKDKEKEKE